MISSEEIQQLAELARLSLTGGEIAALQKDISDILDYVGQVSAASVSTSKTKPGLRNVLREDTERTDALLSGKRDALLKALPKREGDYAVVRKIIEK